MKIIDFGGAQIMTETMEVQFQRGVAADFTEFTMVFCAAVLYPEQLMHTNGANFDPEQQTRLRTHCTQQEQGD